MDDIIFRTTYVASAEGDMCHVDVKDIHGQSFGQAIPVSRDESASVLLTSSSVQHTRKAQRATRVMLTST
jgi:hypothetical protein